MSKPADAGEDLGDDITPHRDLSLSFSVVRPSNQKNEEKRGGGGGSNNWGGVKDEARSAAPARAEWYVPNMRSITFFKIIKMFVVSRACSLFLHASSARPNSPPLPRRPRRGRRPRPPDLRTSEDQFYRNRRGRGANP